MFYSQVDLTEVIRILSFEPQIPRNGVAGPGLAPKLRVLKSFRPKSKVEEPQRAIAPTELHRSKHEQLLTVLRNPIKCFLVPL